MAVAVKKFIVSSGGRLDRYLPGDEVPQDTIDEHGLGAHLFEPGTVVSRPASRFLTSLSDAQLQLLARETDTDIAGLSRRQIIALFQAEPAEPTTIEPAKPAEPAEPKPDDLDGLTILELRQIAEDTGVELGDATKKADIIALIRASQSE